MKNKHPPANSEPAKTTRVRAHRVSAADLTTAKEMFEAATLLVSPDHYTQRQAFGELMPHLFMLQSNGWSWQQLTKLVNDSGFKLASSTVRRYFEEFKNLNLQTYQKTMNERLLLMKEVSSQTQGMDLAAIPGRVAEILNAFSR